MAFSDIPKCALDCYAAALPGLQCNATDVACLCADAAFGSAVSNCALASCSVIESLITQNATYSGCGFHETNHDLEFVYVNAALYTIQVVVFTLRMLCRGLGLASWGWDDTTIVIAFISVLVSLAGAIFQRRNGLGRNIWTLRPEQITIYLQLSYILQITYFLTLAAIKSSILFLYSRVFPSRSFKRTVWASQAFNLCLALACAIAATFQCTPVSYFWLGWDGTRKGTCTNINAFAWASAGINIALDFWMLVLPMTQVWQLKLDWRRKAGLVAMFGVGIFLTIASIVRLTALSTFTRSRNSTMDFFNISLWSSVEICMGMVVACLPAVRLITVRVWSKFVTGTRSRLAGYSDASRTVDGSHAGITSRSRTTTGKAKPLGSQEFDKNRRYSSRVVVKGGGLFRLGSEEDAESAYELRWVEPRSMEDHEAREFEAGHHHAEWPLNSVGGGGAAAAAARASNNNSPAGRLGKDDRVMTPTQTKIWVHQGVSVVRTEAAEDDTVTGHNVAGASSASRERIDSISEASIDLKEEMHRRL